MISLRHHVITLVAVFLALAVGVALGSGVLRDADDEQSLAATPGADPAAEQRIDSGERFAAAVGPALTTGKLADRLAAADAAVHVLHRGGKAGLGAAYLAGFAWAQHT